MRKAVPKHYNTFQDPIRILIWSIYYAPDLIGVSKYASEMAVWLAGRGHEVRVVTAPPYYPAWKVPAPYRAGRYTKETVSGIEVIRCPLYVPENPSGVKRLLHHASFAASSSPAVVWASRQFRPDVLFAIAPSFLITPASPLAAWVGGATPWLHVQDFEIDAAFELGLLRGERLRRGALRLERRLLRPFYRVSSISPKMIEALERKGVPPERTAELRNWIDTAAIAPGNRVTSYRQALQISPQAIVALYSGNMANKQGIEHLAEAARCLAARRSDIVFLLCGRGPMAARLAGDTQALPNVRLIDLQPAEKFSELLATADIHLLPQRAAAADLVLPSKLAGMLSSGRPVVAMAEPGTQLFSEVDGVGIAIQPGDTQRLVAAIEKLADDSDLRSRLGHAARTKAVARWDMNSILTEFEENLSALVLERRQARLPVA